MLTAMLAQSWCLTNCLYVHWLLALHAGLQLHMLCTLEHVQRTCSGAVQVCIFVIVIMRRMCVCDTRATACAGRDNKPSFQMAGQG